MSVKVSNFKGNPVISLIGVDDPDARFPFTFGLAKARLILRHISDIEIFVKEKGSAWKKEKGGKP